ncbi:MAG: DUF1203 domain-containing protein [Sneathiella sp.]
MTVLLYKPIPTDKVRTLQNGRPDANGQLPERRIADEEGLPCRHCLEEVAIGDEYLILSYKPFKTTQPYAEQGPIFLHAKECRAYSDVENLPAMYVPENSTLLRGYDHLERIVYGTGEVVKNTDIAKAALKILNFAGVTHVHARSATNNCFQYRIDPVWA